MRITWTLFVASLVSIPGQVRAQEPTTDLIDAPADKESYRGGFSMSLTPAATLGSSVGTPSDYARRNEPEHEVDTGWLPGYRGTLVLGGTLTNWFTVGVGISVAEVGNGSLSAQSTTFLFHIEAFPLYSMGKTWRDIGVITDFGTGSASVERKGDGTTVANAAPVSTLGLGAFWEPLTLGPVAAGPSISYQLNRTHWFTQQDISVGARVVFYGSR